MTFVGANDFTTFTQAAGSRIIYVSDSQGNNANDGFSVNTPVKTLTAGLALMRDIHSDWLLFRQGDTFINQVFGTLNIGGISADQPAVVGTYHESQPGVVNPPTGNARPLFSVPAASAPFLLTANNYVAFSGFYIKCRDRDPTDVANFTIAARDSGVITAVFQGATKWVLWEDVEASHWPVWFQQSPSAGTYIEIMHGRYLLTHDNYGGITFSTASNLYKYMRLYRCVWDLNGFNDTTGSEVYTKPFEAFSHGLYMDAGNPPVIGQCELVECIYARDVRGFHARAGGIRNNCFIASCTAGGDFGRPVLGANHSIINEVAAEMVDEPHNPITVNSISNASPAFVNCNISTNRTTKVQSLTVANPAVFGIGFHQMGQDQPLIFTTSGVLPTGIVAGKVYYIVAAGFTTNQFEVSATIGGTAIGISNAGTGNLFINQVGANPIYGGITNLTSVTVGPPTVWNLTGQPLLNDTPIFMLSTGTLPTGFQIRKIYWVINRTVNSFQLSATKGGVVVNASDVGTGTHQYLAAWPSPTHATAFGTTGTLPAPLAINTLYWVLDAGYNENGFEISATQGGSAINTTTNGSGVHTAYDVEQSTSGTYMTLFHVFSLEPAIDFDLGAAVIKNCLFTNYAGGAVTGPFVAEINPGTPRANVTIDSLVIYKWPGVSVADIPARGTNGLSNIKDDGHASNPATITNIIQDNTGIGTDSVTGLAITQYTTASANSATTANYAASIGVTTSLDGLMTAIKSRAPGSCPYNLTAAAINDSFRGKFNMVRYFPPVAGFPFL